MLGGGEGGIRVGMGEGTGRREGKGEERRGVYE